MGRAHTRRGWLWKRRRVAPPGLGRPAARTLRSGPSGRQRNQGVVAARSRVEAKYLDGHPALFPAAIRDWAERLEAIETLAGLAERIAELDGLDPSSPEEPDAVVTRVDQLVDDLVEPARVKALDASGEGRRAVAIAMRWLEPKMRADPDPGSAGQRHGRR